MRLVGFGGIGGGVFEMTTTSGRLDPNQEIAEMEYRIRINLGLNVKLTRYEIGHIDSITSLTSRDGSKGFVLDDLYCDDSVFDVMKGDFEGRKNTVVIREYAFRDVKKAGFAWGSAGKGQDA